MTSEVYNVLRAGLVAVQLAGEETKTIFDVQIPLGNSNAIYKNAIVANLQEISDAYEQGVEDMTIQFIAKDGEAGFEKTYLDFQHKNGS